MAGNDGYITVVSGLPRSGTSMMMQMLQAGGTPILTDGVRVADADNPRGYREFEPVKKLSSTQGWVAEAAGKAVKVVHVLLPLLPAEFAYRVILMVRDVREVVASQRAMLQRTGKSGANLSDARLVEIFTMQMERTVAWLAANASCRVLEVSHRACFEDGPGIAANVNRFLGGGLDEARMVGEVDVALYRQKA